VGAGRGQNRGDAIDAQKRPYFTTFELILLALFAALVVVAKIALRLPLQMPGHSGLFWMAIVVAAAGIVPKRGAASLVGLSSGILAGFLGLGDFGALDTLVSYAAVGVGVDLAGWLLGNLEALGSAALVGALGHTAKFLVKWAFGLIVGAPVGFLALGLAWSAFNYVIFGALGGLLGGLTLRALRKAGFFTYIQEKR